VPTIAKVLQARIADVARWTIFDSLAVIFESSERADPLIEEAFQGFALEEGDAPIPVECYFMRKPSGTAGENSASARLATKYRRRPIQELGLSGY